MVDEDQPWDGDIMFGDGGDDYMEGNHGADWMFGGDDEDDMIGGGSADDGAIVADRDPAGLFDGADVMHGDAEDDVMTGDNARINRIADGRTWSRLDAPIWRRRRRTASAPYDQTIRVTDMFAGDAGADTHGDDYMTGDTGNDEMYGQLGDDFVLGNAGDDALVGDLGQVRANLIGDVRRRPGPETIVRQLAALGGDDLRERLDAVGDRAVRVRHLSPAASAATTCCSATTVVTRPSVARATM